MFRYRTYRYQNETDFDTGITPAVPFIWVDNYSFQGRALYFITLNRSFQLITKDSTYREDKAPILDYSGISIKITCPDVGLIATLV